MFTRQIANTLAKRLSEPRQFIQIVIGPRQTGKTTAIKQAIDSCAIPYRFAAADSVGRLTADWIETEWRQARTLTSNNKPAIFIIDEIQKIPQWSEIVKRLWDEDSWNNTPLIVVLSGSSSLLIKKGLSESLTGRFELIHSTHWSFPEMKEAFGYSLDDYLYFGGYPGAAPLRHDEHRWKNYMHDSIIESTIAKDVLQLEEIRKPALMKSLFELGAQYSAQELSYRKILGQLDDKGNTDIIKHYLDLLDNAGMLRGLQKYHEKSLEIRSSSPRLMVYDPSLMSATWETRGSLLDDPSLRGHLIETAIGATLLARSKTENFSVFWWRDDNKEVDFVLEKNDTVIALEVKSGKVKQSGINQFCKAFPYARPLIIGDRNTPVDDFLAGLVTLF